MVNIITCAVSFLPLVRLSLSFTLQQAYSTMMKIMPAPVNCFTITCNFETNANQQAPSLCYRL